MIASQTLDGQNRPCGKLTGCQSKDISWCIYCELLLLGMPDSQLQLRSTLWAGIWLGMKTPIGWIVILRLTRRTHWKASHTCPRPIVRQGLDNCETRAAV